MICDIFIVYVVTVVISVSRATTMSAAGEGAASTPSWSSSMEARRSTPHRRNVWDVSQFIRASIVTSK